MYEWMYGWMYLREIYVHPLVCVVFNVELQ